MLASALMRHLRREGGHAASGALRMLDFRGRTPAQCISLDTQTSKSSSQKPTELARILRNGVPPRHRVIGARLTGACGATGNEGSAHKNLRQQLMHHVSWHVKLSLPAALALEAKQALHFQRDLLGVFQQLETVCLQSSGGDAGDGTISLAELWQVLRAMSLDTYAPALQYVLEATGARESAADQYELMQSTRVDYRKFLARMDGRQASAGRGAALTKEVLAGSEEALVTTEAVANRFDDSNAILWLTFAGRSSAISLHRAGLELLGVLDAEHGNDRMLGWAKRQQATEVQTRALQREAAARVTRAVQRSAARSRYMRRRLLLHSHSDCKTAARHAHAEAMGRVPLWWWRSRHIPLSLGAGCGLDSRHGRDQLGACETAEPRHRRWRRLRRSRTGGARRTADLPVRDCRGQSGFVAEIVVPVQLPGSSVPWHMCGRASITTGQPGCERCCIFEFDGQELPSEAIGLPINDAKGSALRQLLDDIGVRGGLAGLGMSEYLVRSEESPPVRPLPLSAGKAASLIAHSIGAWVQRSCPDKQFRIDFAASGSTTAIATRIRRALRSEPLWRMLTVTVPDDIDLSPGHKSLRAVLLGTDGQERALDEDLVAERPPPPYPSDVSAQGTHRNEVDVEAESEGSRLVSYSDSMDRDICTMPAAFAAPSAAAKHEWRVSRALLEVPNGWRVSAALVARSCGVNLVAVLRALSSCNGRSRPAETRAQEQRSFAAIDTATKAEFRIVFGSTSQRFDAAIVAFDSSAPSRGGDNALVPRIAKRALVLRKPRIFDTTWFSELAAEQGAAERVQCWWRQQRDAAQVERDHSFRCRRRESEWARAQTALAANGINRKGAPPHIKEQGDHAKALARQHEYRARARRATRRAQLRLAVNDHAGGTGAITDTTHIGPLAHDSQSSDEFLSDEYMLPGESSSDQDSVPAMSLSSSFSSTGSDGSRRTRQRKQETRLHFADDVPAPDDGLSAVSSVISDADFVFASDTEFDVSSSSGASKDKRTSTIDCAWDVEILDEAENRGHGRWLNAEISQFVEATHRATVWIPAHLLEGEIDLDYSQVRFLRRRRVEGAADSDNDASNSDSEANLFSRLRSKARAAQDVSCNWLIALRDEDSGHWIGGSANRYRMHDNSLFVSFPSLNLEGPMELDGAHVKLVSCESGDTTARDFFALVKSRLEAGIAPGGEPASATVRSPAPSDEPTPHASKGIPSTNTAAVVEWQCEVHDDDGPTTVTSGWLPAVISRWDEETNLVFVSAAELEGEILLDSTFVRLRSCAPGQEDLFARALAVADATARAHHGVLEQSTEASSNGSTAARQSLAISEDTRLASCKEGAPKAGGPDLGSSTEAPDQLSSSTGGTAAMQQSAAISKDSSLSSGQEEAPNCSTRIEAPASSTAATNVLQR